MLNIFKSNKIETITNELAQRLKECPPSITENIDISVHNYLLGKWMRDQITIRNEISALYEFQTITKYTSNLLKKIDPNINDAEWEFESIKWKILDSLLELREYEESFPLRKWLSKYESNNKKVDKDIYILCKSIARIFIDYLKYRPELINHWHQNKKGSKKLFKNLKINQYWQPILFKIIESKALTKPPTIFIINLINNPIDLIKDKDIFINKQNHIIAINNLSELQINLYLKLSEVMTINLYLLSPGEELWERINTEEGVLSFQTSDSRKHLNKQGIEMIYGKLGSDFQKLIEEAIFNNQIETKTNRFYFKNNIHKEGAINLLEQLQDNLINDENNILNISKSDDSIVFSGNQNMIEQLEFIKEKIIDIYKSNEGISFDDIAIISPNINNIKHYLKYIFKDGIDNGYNIPYLFCSKEYKDISNLYKIILEIIEISNTKLTIDKFNYLISNDISALTFNYTQEEKEEIINILKEVGFHWGLDSNERCGEYLNSLDWCLERIILGTIYDEDTYIKDTLISPYNIKNKNIEVHKWIKILKSFSVYLQLLRGSHNLETWINKIKTIANDFKDKNNSNKEEAYEINRILDEYKSSIDSDSILDINVIRDILDSIFNKQSNIFTNRNNQILIGDLESIRLIPQKIFFLLDMNENFYPKQIPNESINIMNNNYIFGDPLKIDKERYLFLELLLSVRKRLFICWTNYDDDNNKLEISTPIRQLVYYLESFIDNKKGFELFKFFNDDGKYQNNDANNIEQNYNYALIKQITWEEKKHTNEYRLIEIINWLKDPQITWLKNKKISTLDRFIHNGDDENISSYQKYKFFRNISNKIGIEDPFFTKKLSEINIQQNLISGGIIAPKNSIYSKANEMRVILDSLISIFNQIKPIEKKTIKFVSNKIEYYVSNNEIVELIHSKLNLKIRSEVWIRLLFISSINNKIIKTKIIFRDKNKYKTEILSLKEPYKSKELLLDYINIQKNSLINCLPVPPESSFNYIKALLQNKDENKAFSESWLGISNFYKGEKYKPEMKLCFGDVPSSFFLENQHFQRLAMRIYYPLVLGIDK